MPRSARRVVPLPRNGSSTMSFRCVQSKIASVTIRSGFTVGCTPVSADAAFREKGSSASEKWVQHNVVPLRTVQDRVCNHQKRFHGRMFPRVRRCRVPRGGPCGGVMPDIRPIAPELAELDVILMGLLAALKNKNQFMAR